MRCELYILPEEKALYYFYRAKCHRFLNETEAQLECLLKGLDFLEEEEKLLRAKFYDELSILYRKSDVRIGKAFEYINQAIAIKKTLADSNELSNSYYLKGHIFYRNRNVDKDNLDSALVYFKQANNLNSIEENYYNTLGAINTIYSLQGKQLDKLEENYLKIINYRKEVGDKASEALTLNSLSSLYIKEGRYTEAKSILDTLSDFVIKSNTKKHLRAVIANRYKLSKVLGDYKSALYWSDSLYSITYSNLNIRLNEIIKEHENEKLKLEIVEARASSYKNRLWVSILGGISGTSLLIFFGLYKYLTLRRQKAEEALAAAKMKMAYDATNAKMEGEQNERESIASVLHDQVASLLTAADLHLNVAKNQDPSAVGITKAVGIIKDINNHVRDLSHQLVSPSLIKFGLEAGLDSLVERMQTDRTHISYISKLGDKRYKGSLEAFIHQCASELLGNVLKHSNATLVKVYLSDKEGSVMLSVTDNGDNADSNITGHSGLGLTHIKARAAALDGHFSFTLDPTGTESLLKIPAIELVIHR